MWECPGSSASPTSLPRRRPVCLLDELAHPAQDLPAPVPELGDPLVNALRCRLALVGIRLLHVLLPKLPVSSRIAFNRLCRRGDLDPHALAGTSPSSYSHREANLLPSLGPQGARGSRGRAEGAAQPRDDI